MKSEKSNAPRSGLSMIVPVGNTMSAPFVRSVTFTFVCAFARHHRSRRGHLRQRRAGTDRRVQYSE